MYQINKYFWCHSELNYLGLFRLLDQRLNRFPFLPRFLFDGLDLRLIICLQFLQYHTIRKLLADVHVHIPVFWVNVIPLTCPFWVVENVLPLFWLPLFPLLFYSLLEICRFRYLSFIVAWVRVLGRVVLLVKVLALSSPWFHLTEIWFLSRLLKMRLIFNFFAQFCYFTLNLLRCSSLILSTMF